MLKKELSKLHNMLAAGTAIGVLMVGCSESGMGNTDSSVDDELSEGLTQIAVSANCLNVTTRGQGPAGGLEGDEDMLKWPDNAKLHIFAVNTKTGGDLLMQNEDLPPIIIGGKDTDYMGYPANPPIKDGDYMVFQDTIFYYPRRGSYYLMGYYVGEEEEEESPTIGKPTLMDDGDGNKNGIVIPVTIDGSNDVMTAFSVAPTTRKDCFSAASARAGFVPHLNFKHEMSQFRFFAFTTDPQVKIDYNKMTGVYITNITIKDVNTKGNIVVSSSNPGNLISWNVDDSHKEDVNVKFPDRDGDVFIGEGVAPNVDITQIGEPLILPSNKNFYKMELTIRQLFNGEEPIPEDQQFQTTEHIIERDKLGYFEPGRCYDVYINLFSLPETKVRASMTSWKYGEDISISNKPKGDTDNQ